MTDAHFLLTPRNPCRMVFKRSRVCSPKSRYPPPFGLTGFTLGG